MAKKIKTTRPELKRYRDALARYERYLPMLKLKQQQLQMTLRDVGRQCEQMTESLREISRQVRSYEAVLFDVAGLNVPALAEPEDVKTSASNIAGVNIPVFESATFAEVSYNLFGTPPWVDRTLADLRERNLRQAKLDVLRRQQDLLHRELVRIIQRVNLFEKIKVPEAKEAIRIIRIQLGDEMTAAVGRGKIAKGKLAAMPAYERGNQTEEAEQEDSSS